jgi:hypothetical protein
MKTYSRYQDDIKIDIKKCLDKMGCQPILFIGSGLSRRYINAPNWDNLLEVMASKCPLITKNVDYYKQSNKNSIEIGSIFSDFYKEWAWEGGRDQFPSEFFSQNYKSDIFIKYFISQYLKDITLYDWYEKLEDNLKSEVNFLRQIAPHAIITTNYDTLIEKVFTDYQTVIGQKILKTNMCSFGELFKIHGCVTEPDSLVFHEQDYDEFKKKKKYLSAKLLTFFAEHPLLFVGYSANDPNIKAILSDIDEIISNDGSSIDNIYMLEYDTNLNEKSYPVIEKIIPIDENKNVTVKTIKASEYGWVFESFINSSVLNPINPKLLRALLARSYDLVRCDIPRGKIEINYETLERMVDSDKELPTLLGMTRMEDPSKFNMVFLYSISEIANILNLGHWSNVQKLIDKIKEDKNVDIKSSDNEFHAQVKTGQAKTSKTHKYSQNAVELFKKVKSGFPYEIKI